ncbi:peptidase m14 [Colletotrichum kahawae]|uniref:Peptidase m14 n=1 Tax=Colletotrichum kahawae TaxID=34407 RepID=A0AAD9YDT1_COLKA|nr:peptidase m14 [Colletotrichum kahawae]
MRQLNQLVSMLCMAGAAYAAAAKSKILPDFAPVSLIDRFTNCSDPPAGPAMLGAAHPQFDTILSTREVESAIYGLKDHFNVTLTAAPYKSAMGFTTVVIGIPPTHGRQNETQKKKNDTSRLDPDRPRGVLLTSGFQGRERGGPDSLVYFLSDLLHAHKNKKGLTYGRVRFSHGQVETVVREGLTAIPMVNPDGIVWDQRHNSCWGKNRNGLGVNIDRNFDIVWDYKRFFSKKAMEVASDWPSHELYHGRKPFSEAESRNVEWVIENDPEIGYFVNAGPQSPPGVAGPWDIDTTQSENPSMNWRNRFYDGTRGVRSALYGGEDNYGEYMPPADLIHAKARKHDIEGQMMAVSGRHFQEEDRPRPQLSASGTATDWAYSRHIINASATKIFSFRMNFGRTRAEAEGIAWEGGCPFYPTSEQYKNGLAEAAAGYMRFLLSAADKKKD